MSSDQKIGSADTVVVRAGSGRAPADAGDSLEGTLIAGRYDILALLGRGGTGAVYRARDRELDEIVALKVLHEDIGSSVKSIDLLRSEVRLARRVTHRNVARIYEFSQHSTQCFLTMEYIDGDPLSQRLRRTPALTVPRTVEVLRAVCRGLQAAHDAQVIHRDIKPDNVLIDSRGRVVLTDFGIGVDARIGNTPGVFAGTPAYMAPEQLAGETSIRSDLFSLGVMAYEMFSGALPWAAETDDTSGARAARGELDLDGITSGVSPAMAQVIRRALATDPDDRYSSAAELSNALSEALPDSSTTLDRGHTTSSTSGAHHIPPKRSVAVLPFRNRGGEDDAYLADGVTEDLIDGLCELSALRVLSRGAVMRFTDDNREAHEIGQALNVETVIDGSIRRAGDELRLTVRAITVADGYQVWAKRFDVRPEDLLGVSDDIVAALSPALAAGDEVIPRAEAIPSEAMELYLKARTAYRSMSDNQRATDLFERAHELAPDSAVINAGLAMTLMRRWMIKPADDEDLIERGRASAERAISAAPQLGEPHLALGYFHLHTGDTVRAVAEFRAAIARAPSLADAHGILGGLLSEMGRASEARRRLTLARELDPTLTGPFAELKRAAALARDWKRLDEYIAASPPRVGFDWMFAIRLDAFRGSREHIESTAAKIEAEPDDPYNARRIALSLAEAYLGRADLETSLARLPVANHAGVSARRLAFGHQLRAEVAGHLGGIGEALDELEAASRAGLIDVLWLNRCPQLASVRDEDRFHAVREVVQDRAFAAYDAVRGGL